MMNPKNKHLTVGLLFGTLVLGGALAAGTQTNFFGLIGPQPDGTGLTPNHWTLAPAGLSVEIGDRPMGTATSPDGRYIAVSNDGQGVQSLALFDTATRKVVQRIPYSSPESLYLGVAWSPDGKTLYASAGGNNKVRVYSFDGSQLSEGAPIVLGDASIPSYPAGLAVSPDGKTLYAALNLGNAVVAIDTGSRAATSLKTLKFGDASKAEDIGTLPYALLLSSDGKTLYVSHWNARAVSMVDTATMKTTAQVKVGDHPTGLALSPDGSTLYVANANSDSVSAIDTKNASVRDEVKLAPYEGAPAGSMPNALSVTPDGRTLLVANGGNNDVALIDTASLKVRGLVPTAWFPSTVSISKDGKFMYVTNMKGLGAGPNPDGPIPNKRNPQEQYIANMARGTLQTVALPNDTELSTLTVQVVKNNGFDETRGVLTRSAAETTPHAVPRRVGDPSLIKHVIYVIKENRTYDQVLGDVKGGNGEAALTLFGQDVTPNQHALASTFGLFDNFYADAEVSADGHNWTMGGVATDYVQKNWPANYSGRNRPYDFEGDSPASAPTGGYLFDYAKRAGLSYRSYGEFTDFASKPPNMQPARFMPALAGHVAPAFPGYDLAVTDQSRVDAWKAEFGGYVKDGKLPQLSVVRLPRDHTAGTRAGAPTPSAYVADNDLAVGRLAEAVSNSPYWKDTAIFVVEDDAQNGPDHVDAHRTTAYVISAYNKRNLPDHTFYSTVSMLRTMELMLGLPPMTQFDAAATPMMAAFQDTPDLTPYQAVMPKQPLDQMNASSAYRQQDSQALDLSREDRADMATFNDIIWHSVKGKNVPMPVPKTAFHPSVFANASGGTEKDDR
jgi:YVTN family beta-propeller protein